ncbi:DNA-directed RNA polymerase III subunit RPC7 isoform X2 [Conger conger]|uniref:DNA-directed RNA polymerase III subunit RPC7 isoform X2 n=1 Tax=Conger conger TaxID=82655 RepID=UPI002A59D60A|nr:DNA-directed RNA polymerase III subunit RPC7 isoform X2 [Conger conger]
MAGGKGRGIAAFTFNIDALGITRGSMPETARGPRALFPDMEYKPGPLKAGEDEDYMLALKQEMRGTMKRLPYNIPLPEKKGDVERYKEKYTRSGQKEVANDWTPEVKKKSKKETKEEKEELLTRLDELEKKDGEPDEEKEGKKKGEGEEDEEELEAEEYDEEEVEEENDYISSYFDNGEEFGGGSDDNMDEATY